MSGAEIPLPIDLGHDLEIDRVGVNHYVHTIFYTPTGDPLYPVRREVQLTGEPFIPTSNITAVMHYKRVEGVVNVDSGKSVTMRSVNYDPSGTIYINGRIIEKPAVGQYVGNVPVNLRGRNIVTNQFNPWIYNSMLWGEIKAFKRHFPESPTDRFNALVADDLSNASAIRIVVTPTGVWRPFLEGDSVVLLDR